MLQNLLQAANWSSPFPPQAKLRALRSLKHIFKGLMTKRFVAEPVVQQPGQPPALGACCFCSYNGIMLNNSVIDGTSQFCRAGCEHQGGSFVGLHVDMACRRDMFGGQLPPTCEHPFK